MEKRFPEGIYFGFPAENAPEFVVGKISIKSDVFLDWLNSEKPNDRGYVNLEILKGKKDGRPFCVVNDFVPKKQDGIPVVTPQPNSTVDEDAPF